MRREVQPSLRPMWVTWGQQRWQGSARVFEDYGTRNLPEVLTLGDAILFQEKLGEGVKERRYRGGLPLVAPRFRLPEETLP